MKVSSQDFEAGLAPLRFQLQSKNSKAVLEGSLAACSLASEGFTETAVANHPGFITDLVTAFTTRGQSVTAKTALAQALEIISTCDAGARNVAGAVSGALPEVVEALSGPTTFDTIHLRRFLCVASLLRSLSLSMLTHAVCFFRLKLLSNLLVQGLLSGTHVKELTRSFRECSGPDVGDGCVVALADKCMKASSSLIGVM